MFYFSSIPGQDIPQLFTGQDIFFHIIEYTILALLISRALREYNPGLIYTRRFLWVFLISVVYAISDEYHQIFVAGRYASSFDLFMDGLGSFIGSLIYR